MTVYFYELPMDRQMMISKSVRDALRGIVADDRLDAEVNCVISGRLDDIAKVVRIEEV